MTNERQHSPQDEALHALVDDQLEESARGEVRAAVKGDAALGRRVREYELLNEALFRQSLEIDKEPVPDRLLQAAVGARRPAFPAARAAGLLLVGALVGYLSAVSLPAVQPFATPVSAIDTNLVKPAAIAHAVFSPEIRHPVEVSGEQEAHLVAWLSKRLDTPLKAPRLGDYGYALVGGRLLPSTDGAAAQFMYESTAGTRITLYVRRGAWDNPQSAFSFGERGRLQVFYWIDGAVGYALAADMPRQELLGLGETVYRELNR